MKRILAVVVFVALAVAAAPVFADVTIKTTMSASAGPMAMETTSVMYIKGTKARTDVKATNQDVSILVDAAAKQQLMINHTTKEVSSLDAQPAMANLPVSIGELKVSMQPSGQTREILGHTCNGFTIAVTMPMTIGDETITMTMSGPVWIAKDGPGVAEYQAFFKASAAAGLTLSPLAQGPQGKGMAEMQNAFAQNGMPMEQQMQMRVEGSGQMAQMMGQMNMAITTKVADISSDPIPDDRFAVPAGYTKK